jgi:hypothetical protein
MDIPRIFQIGEPCQRTGRMIWIYLIMLRGLNLKIHRYTQPDIPSEALGPNGEIMLIDPPYEDEEYEEPHDFAPSHTFLNILQFFVGINFVRIPHIGNTLLLHIEGLDYVHIDTTGIIKFTAKNKIIDYKSPDIIGSIQINYAVDERGRLYMFNGYNTILLHREVSQDDGVWDEDIYDDFYEATTTSIDEKNFQGITEYFLRDYNDGEWRKIPLFYDPCVKYNQFLTHRITQNGIIRDVDVAEIRQIMIDYARSINIESFNETIIE